MSSRQYITKAIVCGSKRSMTSDKSYLLFTQELGMLWATARSVRMEKSKQRYALQDFSSIRVSLVQGKSVWRIGSVEALENAFLASQSRIARGGVSFVVKALRRYVHGEQMVSRAFIDVEAILKVIPLCDDTQKMEVYQNMYTLRLLDELGYITHTDEIKKLLQEESIINAVSHYTSALATYITKSIDQATQASHL